jgi:hypothetical protein
MLSISSTSKYAGAALSLFLYASTCSAGIDIIGTVERVQIAPDGKIWFSMDTTSSSTYCKSDWNGLNMYIPKDSPEYPYYFAMLLTAASKGKRVLVANISRYDGSTPCDITQTGYGLVFYQ